jgi:hypothetical protein
MSGQRYEKTPRKKIFGRKKLQVELPPVESDVTGGMAEAEIEVVDTLST